ncbi:hypothetical protein JCM10213v2_008425 [Rhodosporidiobolus nylandii]
MPFSREEDAKLAAAVLKQHTKHPGRETQWTKVAGKLERATGEECEMRWGALVHEVTSALEAASVDPEEGTAEGDEPWSDPESSLLLASIHFFLTDPSTPASTASDLSSPPTSTNRASITAWIFARLRAENHPGPEAERLAKRPLKACYDRWQALKAARVIGRSAKGKGKAKEAEVDAEEVVEKLMEVGAAIEKTDEGWEDEVERVARWVGLRAEVEEEASYAELVAAWNEKRIEVLAGQLKLSKESKLPAPKGTQKRKPSKGDDGEEDEKPKPKKKRATASSGGPDHGGQPWDEEQEKKLCRLRFIEKRDWDEIQRQMGRTKGSVKSRCTAQHAKWSEKGWIPPSAGSAVPPITGLAASRSAAFTSATGDILVNAPAQESSEEDEEIDQLDSDLHVHEQEEAAGRKSGKKTKAKKVVGAGAS